MTTYYGVWSGEEWWGGVGGSGLFRTTEIAVANAQALAANFAVRVNQYSGVHWEVRAIGEDGLPVENEARATVDLLVDAETRLRELPSVEAAHVIVEFILHRTAGLLSPPQFAEYVQGVKAIAKTITGVLGTDRGVSLIGTIGGGHAVDIMREG